MIKRGKSFANNEPISSIHPHGKGGVHLNQELRPHFLAAFGAGRTLYLAGYEVQASTYLRQALGHFSGGEPAELGQLGDLSRSLGMQQIALDAYSTAIEQDPGLRDLVLRAVELCQELGKIQTGLEICRRSKAGGEHPAVLGAHGRLLLQVGKRALALSTLERAVILWDRSPWSSQTEAFKEQAKLCAILVQSYWEAGNYSRARAALRRVPPNLGGTHPELLEIGFLLSAYDWVESAASQGSHGEVFTYLLDLVRSMRVGQYSAEQLQFWDLLSSWLAERPAMKARCLMYRGLLRLWCGDEGGSEDIDLAKVQAPEDPEVLWMRLAAADPDDRILLAREAMSRHADLPWVREMAWPGTLGSPSPEGSLRMMALGGGTEIGGSCLYLEIGPYHLLVDCGMRPGTTEAPTFPDLTLLERVGLSGPLDIDAFFLTHAHLDHSAGIPLLLARHPGARIHCTHPTRSLCKVLWRDLLRNQDTFGGDQMEASMDPMDISKAFDALVVHEERSSFEPLPGLRVTFFPAGHILGATSILFEHAAGNVLVTGDYSIRDQLTVKGLQLPSDLQVDLLVSESTYGWEPGLWGPAENPASVLKDLVTEVTASGGSVLIPAFSVGRAQEVLLMLHELAGADGYLPFSVFVDGRVLEVCREYDRYLGTAGKGSLFFKRGVQEAPIAMRGMQDFTQFVQQRVLPGGACVVASSGMMMPGTASARYAAHMLAEEQHAIIFTGYLDEESPGSRLLSWSEGEIEWEGHTRQRRCQVYSARLSAHASREELLQTCMYVRPRWAALVHGEGRPSTGLPCDGLDHMLRSLEGLRVVRPATGEVHTFA